MAEAMNTMLGGLRCRVMPESGGKPAYVAVLSHGFGAPGDDLVPLYDELLALKPELKRVRFVFPEAPLELDPFARAWWMIDARTVMQLQASDPSALREFRKVEPEGMAKARAMMLKLVDDVAVQTGAPIVLGGFSQGGMISTDVALRLEQRPLALVVMSGTLLIEDVWRAKAKARAGLPVLQSHGREDPLLAFMTAEWLRDLLVEAGLKVDFVPFSGGHTIPLNVLEKLAGFLDALLHEPSGGVGAKIPT
jgi:phospholipase/carboxylesterase